MSNGCEIARKKYVKYWKLENKLRIKMKRITFKNHRLSFPEIV